MVTQDNADGSWKANPAPYNAKVDLTNQYNNIINLNYKEIGPKSAKSVDFDDPSLAVLDQPIRYIHLGGGSQHKSVTIKVQREIVRYVIGTHPTTTQSYPEWAKFRQKKW